MSITLVRGASERQLVGRLLRIDKVLAFEKRQTRTLHGRLCPPNRNQPSLVLRLAIPARTVSGLTPVVPVILKANRLICRSFNGRKDAFPGKRS